MSENIIVAIIGAVAIVLAALIGLFGKEKSKSEKTVIKQKAKGKNSTQIGVQNTIGKSDKNGYC